MQYRVGKTHCVCVECLFLRTPGSDPTSRQGHQDPSKRVPIFLGTPEALIKVVPIGPIPIPRSRTVNVLPCICILHECVYIEVFACMYM